MKMIKKENTSDSILSPGIMEWEDVFHYDVWESGIIDIVISSYFAYIESYHQGNSHSFQIDFIEIDGKQTREYYSIKDLINLPLIEPIEYNITFSIEKKEELLIRLTPLFLLK
jgi:hypothetical protein